jgi:hypothetical protein
MIWTGEWNETLRNSIPETFSYSLPNVFYAFFGIPWALGLAWNAKMHPDRTVHVTGTHLILAERIHLFLN